MKPNILSFSGAAMLALVLLLATPAVWGQMHGGSGMAGQSGSMNQNGNMNHPGMEQNGAMGMQNNAQASFVADMRRNSKVETDLSKLALKNSSNDDVKKLAKQVIAENRRDETTLMGAVSNSSNSGMQFGEPVPSQTRNAEKQMKKLTGVQFDAMYLAQMSGYVANDQKLISEASSEPSSADMGSLTMQMRNTADQRATQIAQVEQSENIKIK